MRIAAHLGIPLQRFYQQYTRAYSKVEGFKLLRAKNNPVRGIGIRGSCQVLGFHPSSSAMCVQPVLMAWWEPRPWRTCITRVQLLAAACASFSLNRGQHWTGAICSSVTGTCHANCRHVTAFSCSLTTPAASTRSGPCSAAHTLGGQT